MNIEEIRKKYPEYGAMSDVQLADAMYGKHYKDKMTREDFFGRISVAIPAEPEERSLAGKAYDVAGEFAAAANTTLLNPLDTAAFGINKILQGVGINAEIPQITHWMNQQGISPTRGDYMEPGTAKDIVTAAGRTLPAGALGLTGVAGRDITQPMGAVAEMLGFGMAPPAVTARVAAEGLKHKLPGKAQARVDANLPVKRGSGDVEAAGYKVNTADPEGPPITDSKAHAAMGQGFGPDFVAMVKAQNRKTKEQMLKILDVAQQGQKNMQFKHKNRPLDIVGDSLLDRIKVVRTAQEEAGKDVRKAAQGLKGQYADPKPAVDNFMESLEEIGVKIDYDNLQFDFSKSDIEELKGLQDPIKRIIRIMKNYGPGEVPDAYDVHRLKKIIDEGTNYSKQLEGLKGSTTERILGDLRSDLDGILDGLFPAYDDANTRYSEAKGALDAVQKTVGRNLDFKDKYAATALGSKVRALGGNYAFRPQLLKSIDDLDAVAQKYNTPAGVNWLEHGGQPAKRITMDDDLGSQVSLISEIERIIGTPATNSFLGDIEKGATRAAEVSHGSFGGVASDVMKATGKKLRGQSEDRAIQYIIDLLED